MPSRPESATSGSQLASFVSLVEERVGEEIPSPRAFDRFAVERYRDFWRLFLEWSDPRREGEPDPVCTSDSCEAATFFPDLRLNYAENLLCGRGDDAATALVARDGDGAVRLSRAELRSQVRRLAGHLRSLGIEPGDRVVSIAGNGAGVIVGALAAATVGATFSSAAPEMGSPAILSRFEQLAPKVLLASLEGRGGSPGLAERVATAASSLPSLEAIVALDGGRLPVSVEPPVLRLSELLVSEPDSPLADGWQRFPFNHPLFILFTSGTTGVPKCIVHGAGGTLLEHLKEQRLHVDLDVGDVLFFQTSTAWMMWNWQLSALACGSAIVVFDGPLSSSATLWEMVAEEGVTVFGTSPPYLQLCEDSGYSPKREAPAPALRSVLSTGSVLRDWQFDWVSEEVGPVKLQSISGGTDIVGCFVLGHPNLPVRRGAIQCRSLGLDVQALPTDQTPSGSPVGELVCRNPFPSRPIGFLGDDDGRRFHEAYFSQNEGVWTHGDLIEFDDDGGARIHGRSDGVLNVQGVRVGPAEIYAALHDVPEVVQSMAVEQRQDSGSRLVLLVVTRDGARVDPQLTLRIRRVISRHATPLHVPQLVVGVEQLPVTYSGKRSERAGRAAVEGERAANSEALANPEALEQIRRAVLAAERTQREEPFPGTAETTLERLRRIWEETLDVEALSPDDDFFALGGTSLIAVELFTLIEERLGVALPPSTLLEAPTIAALTAVVEDPSLRSGALVRMRAGSAGPPLFVVHSISGDVLGMRELCTAMTVDVPVYGIRAHRDSAEEADETEIRLLGKRYATVVRARQPDGPYRIAGHSFGALVAFEIARQLEAQGEQIEWLGIIDGELSTKCHGPLRRWGRKIALPFHYGRAVLRSPRGAFTTAASTARRVLAELALRVFPKAPLEIRPAEWLEEVPPTVRERMIGYLEAADEYRPQPYEGPMTYFLPTERRFHVFADPLPVWRRVARGGIDLVRVPGPHVGMDKGNSGRAIAAKIDADLGDSRA